MNARLAVVLAAAVALTLAPHVVAQMYLVPEGDCADVVLHATRGTSFPALGETIAAGDVKDLFVVREGRRDTPATTSASHSLDFTASLVPEDRVVMAAISLNPQTRGNETRTEHAKTLVFCGNTPLADWQRSTGLALEIYPQGWNGPRPKLRTGDPMHFIAVDKSTRKIVHDIAAELHRAGAGPIATAKANADGHMVFAYPEPGRYMVTTTWRRPDPQQADHWLVDTSTLTFDVK